MKKHSTPPLPPGQRESKDFPRFGLSPFAFRFPRDPDRLRLQLSGTASNEIVTENDLSQLPRVHQVSDFHCVATWSCRSLRWSGYLFRDFYHQIVQPQAKPDEDARLVLFRGQDGYKSSLPLADLLADDVILADRLDGQPLSIEHGAPLRLVAPAHYGYKSVKHVYRIDFKPEGSGSGRSWLRFLDHPRGRVALEERGRGAPGWFLRYLFRPLIGPSKRRFAKAMSQYRRHDDPEARDTIGGDQ